MRDWALAGVWGREVHLVDADGRKYVRGPAGDNGPLSMWSNRWSTMPITLSARPRAFPSPTTGPVLDRMPGSDVPVIRQPFAAGEDLPFWAWGIETGRHRLFDLVDDPAEDHDLAGTVSEAGAAELLRSALVSLEAPDDQLVRLGLS